MPLYFYRMEGNQPSGIGVPVKVAMSGSYATSRFITTTEDYEKAVAELDSAFVKRYPGAFNYFLTALNRLD